MKRENLDFLEQEQIDKVMALYGKAITKKDNEIEKLKDKNKELSGKIETYETKINEFNENSKENAEWKTKYEELQTEISEQEAQRKAEENDKILSNNILDVFGERKFTSNYAKNGLMQDIKNELNKPENKGKGIQEIFDSLTKDQEGIFETPNKLEDMPSMGDSEQNNNTNEMPLFW